MKVEITIDAPSCRKGILQEIREDYEALQHHQDSCDVLLNVWGPDSQDSQLHSIEAFRGLQGNAVWKHGGGANENSRDR